MRPVELMFLVTSLAILLVLAVGSERTGLWGIAVAAVAIVVGTAQILVEGPRWQMAPAYALTGLFVLGWLLRRTLLVAWPVGRVMTAIAVSAGVFGVAIAAAVPVALPVFRFAKTTGPYSIGTVTYHWVDTGRQEVLSADPQARREVMAQVWYPAEPRPSAPRTPYIVDSDIVVPAFAKVHHLRPILFDHLRHVRSDAVASAPIASDRPAYPVVVFWEGLTGFRQMNTFQVQELVSHGFVVVAVDQPYAAAAVTFPDGRTVAGLPLDLANSLIDQSFNPVEPPPVVHGRSFDHGILPHFADDAGFVLDQLSALQAHDPNGILTGHLGLDHIGTIGVSLGGIVASEACRRDKRLKACLIMDAPMPPQVVEAGLRQPSMWITRDADTMRLERRRSGGWSEEDIRLHQDTMRAVFEALPEDGYFLQIPGAFHANFTDMPNWSPLFPTLGLTGPADGQRVHATVNAYTVAFFDTHLRARPSPLLTGMAPYPHVRFETRR